MKENKSIKCDVESCKYCNVKKSFCTRSSIKVSNCDQDEDGFKEFTMCDSYKER
jgi:hypothetical protein